jgi:hypothetical protein
MEQFIAVHEKNELEIWIDRSDFREVEKERTFFVNELGCAPFEKTRGLSDSKQKNGVQTAR